MKNPSFSFLPYLPSRKPFSFTHINPAEAVEAHEHLRCKRSLAMHWGTLRNSYEPYLQPRQRLQEALDARGIEREAFLAVDHGVTMEG